MNLTNLMALEYRPLAAVLISLAASCLVFVPGKYIRTTARELINLTAAVLQTFIVYSMLPLVLKGQEISCVLFNILKDVSFSFNADPAGMVFACTASTLWILISLYSIGYMHGHEEKYRNGWHAAFAMCLSATSGMCFAANLFTFFIFYELLALSAYLLVSQYREEGSKSPDWKYLAYTLISGLFFIAAIVIVYLAAGTTEFTSGGFLTEEMLTVSLVPVVFFMMIFAGLVSAGVMPLHGWLKTAMKAPAPAGALLCAVSVLNAGAFCIVRVVLYVFGPSMARTSHCSDILAWMSVLTIVISSLVAMRECDLKTRMSYSAIGQVSYTVLAVCIFTPFCTAGALYQIVAHSVLSAILFMSIGMMIATAHKQNITEIAGIGRRMPLTMAAYTAASIGVAGFPFFAGFVSKTNIIYGSVAMGKTVFIAMMIAGAVLSLVCLMPIVLIAFRNENNDSGSYAGTYERGENLFMLVPLVLAVLISIVLGLAPNLGLHLFDMSLMAGNSIFTPLI